MRKTKKQIIYILAAVFMVGIGTFLVLEKRHVINLFSKKPSQDTAKTTSTTKTAQENFNKGDPREAGNSLSESKGVGGIVDNNGSLSTSTNTSNPIVSKSGQISVYSPTNNSIISNGTELSGASTLSVVSYRILDNVSGQIARGELNVVGGKFSGKISFATSSPDGRLDIFGTNPDGSEFSNIEIPIRFK